MSTESSPFLSVIIPAKNEGKTICKTVDSLILQDYSCFEIIVVDDGSNDDTIGEDMELVMRIRRFAAESDDPLEIRYTKKALCFTELPWNEKDLRKQRIRWTVGLTDVLWKYREIATHKKYTFLEKLTFWYDVLFEKFSPHIEFASLMISVALSFVCGFSQITIALMAVTISLQFLLSIVGSFSSIIDSVKSSENKFICILKEPLNKSTKSPMLHTVFTSMCYNQANKREAGHPK